MRVRTAVAALLLVAVSACTEVPPTAPAPPGIPEPGTHVVPFPTASARPLPTVSPGRHERLGALPWRPHGTDPSGRQLYLTVELVQCESLRTVRVEETRKTVTVSAYGKPPPRRVQACTDELAMAIGWVALRSPLGHRRLVGPDGPGPVS